MTRFPLQELAARAEGVRGSIVCNVNGLESFHPPTVEQIIVVSSSYNEIAYAVKVYKKQQLRFQQINLKHTVE